MEIIKQNNKQISVGDEKNNDILDLYDKFVEIKQKGWIKGDKKNRGSAGIIFEKLLKNSYNNFELPDYNGIEIKTKSSIREKYVSLFSAVPDSFLFEIKRIVEQYGYPDKQYAQFNIFNMDVYSYKYNKSTSGYYFKLEIDNEQKNIILNVYDKRLKKIDSSSKWSFDLLKEKLERKLNYLAFIKTEKKFEHNEIFFKYNTIEFYKLKDFNTFINLIKKGIIKVVFRIGIYKDEKRLGQVYDHGSVFCIKDSHLERLFQKVRVNNSD